MPPIDYLKGTKERFWNHVERRGDDECWPWKGGKKFYWMDARGFSSMVKPQRAVWAIEHDGVFAHSYDVIITTSCKTDCCNPKHVISRPYWEPKNRENQ